MKDKNDYRPVFGLARDSDSLSFKPIKTLDNLLLYVYS